MRNSSTVVLVNVFAATLVGCGGFCEPGDVQVVGPLAEGQRVAAYVKNCGATVDYSTYVCVLEPGDSLDDGTVAFYSYHAYAIRIRRIGRDTVAVSYMGDVREMDEHVGGITFIYNGNDGEFFDSVHQKWKERPSTGPVHGQYQSEVVRRWASRAAPVYPLGCLKLPSVFATGTGRAIWSIYDVPVQSLLR